MKRPTAYEGPKFSAPIDLDLSRNEGRPWALVEGGLPDGVDRAVSSYPNTTALQTTLADHLGVEPDRLLVTAGGDDALLRCFMALAGATAVTTTPTFEMIRRYSEQTNGGLIEVGWWAGEFPLDEFLAATREGASLAVVVSPNNPTGAAISEADLGAMASNFETVVYDAAYTEFSDTDLAQVALELDNVITIRTLSKAYGLAGLRIGYAVGSPDRIAGIKAYGSPFSVSGVSALIAEQALTDIAPRDLFVDEVRTQRRELTDLLDELGAEPLPSQANFVLARFHNAGWVHGGSASLGVGLRSFPASPELAPYVRVTVPGDRDDFERLEATLRTVLSPEAVIFDLDGVLVADAYTETILQTAASVGAKVTLSEVWEARAAGNANDDWELTRQLCQTAGVDLPFQTIKDRFEQIYQGSGATPGLKDTETTIVDRATIEKIASRLPLGIVTGRPRSDAFEFLMRFDLVDLFGAVVTREDATMKPDPAPVLLALEKLGVKRAWMLGDTVDDIAAARSAGVLPIGVISPTADPEHARINLSEAATVLESTNQLLEVLDAQNI